MSLNEQDKTPAPGGNLMLGILDRIRRGGAISKPSAAALAAKDDEALDGLQKGKRFDQGSFGGDTIRSLVAGGPQHSRGDKSLG